MSLSKNQKKIQGQRKRKTFQSKPCVPSSQRFNLGCFGFHVVLVDGVKNIKLAKLLRQLQCLSSDLIYKSSLSLITSGIFAICSTESALTQIGLGCLVKICTYWTSPLRWCCSSKNQSWTWKNKFLQDNGLLLPFWENPFSAETADYAMVLVTESG